MARKDMIDGATARRVKQMSVSDLNEYLWKIYLHGYSDGIATAAETITAAIKKNKPTS